MKKQEIYDNEQNFIGGAERARRNAQKRLRNGGNVSPYKRSERFGHHHETVTKISKKMKPFDRFFKSLLMSRPIDFERSNGSESARRKLMQEICGRADLPLPSRLQASCKDAREFYSTRCALVMEESRFILADAIDHHHNGFDQFSMKLILKDFNDKIGAHVLLFENIGRERLFTPQQMQDLRPGCVLEIITKGKVGETANFIPLSSSAEEDESVLGTILPQHDQVDGISNLSLLVFRKLSFLPDCDDKPWLVRPLTTLISEARQFEACTRAPKVAFLSKLLGLKDSTHIRFSDSDSSETDGSDTDRKDFNDMEKGNGNTEGCENYKSEVEKVGISLSKTHLRFHNLNPTQECAAVEFLSSPSSTLTLVQGPPGTGKTTFLVSLIYRCLFHSVTLGKGRYTDKCKKRILVTAPSNKAITVLATRFLDVLQSDDTVNVVLIGVEEKLVSDDQPNISSCGMSSDDPLILPSTLSDIFVYRWVESIVDTFVDMRVHLQSENQFRLKLSHLFVRSRYLKRKLERGIPNLFYASEAFYFAEQYLLCLKNAMSISENNASHSEESASLSFIMSQARKMLNGLISNLTSTDRTTLTQELLVTANVIFCTLSTAGTSLMKRTKRINDLFVDEAAAATEPQICIPFHLRPERMLAVGDHMQLPSTVMSRCAANLGLDKSLHERLISDCSKDHKMLETQYRMKPEISVFPSTQFYGGRISNGANVACVKYGREAVLYEAGNPYTFLQVAGSEKQSFGGSYSNMDEAKAVIKVISMIRNASLKTTSKGTIGWDMPERVRIITFYQGQVSLIRRLLQQNGFGRILVATVDSSQGCEADVVILSFVRSNDKKGSVRHTTGFLCDDRRLNVAMTRARFQLICIGNILGTISTAGSDTLKAMVADAKSRQCVMSLDSY